MSVISAVVFDVGKVLLDWDARYLYRQLIPDEGALEAFLAEVVPLRWNLELDRGRDWEEALAKRIARFPQYEALIRAYRERWDEMVPGEIAGTVRLLERLCEQGVPCYALTNFNALTFQRVRHRYAFFDRFRGMLVSGEEGLVKPEPAIYELTVRRFGLDAATTLLIDDSEVNVQAAQACGWQGIVFQNPEDLAGQLVRVGLLPEEAR